MKFASKRAFTMVEIVIIVFLISVGLTGILYALNRGLWFVQQSRETVLAINMAREWMEQIFHIRDTNWRRREWIKSDCRLKTDPLDDSQSWAGCWNDDWIKKWNYIILEKELNTQKYFIASWQNTWLSLSDWLDESDLKYSLCETNWKRSPCPWSKATSKEWQYFRVLEVKWLYRKDVENWPEIDCDNWNDTDDWNSNLCWDWGAKELQFCVRIEYIGKRKSEVELCSMLTNFYK